MFVLLQSIMSIPKPIQSAMASWCKDYAGHIEYLGEYEGNGAFYYVFDEPVELGFPSVYLLNSDNTVDEIDGPEALEIIGLFVENLDEVSVE